MKFAVAEVNYKNKSYNQIPNPTNINKLKKGYNYLEYTSKANLSYHLLTLKATAAEYKCISISQNISIQIPAIKNSSFIKH
jgi:hypothetical protein